MSQNGRLHVLLEAIYGTALSLREDCFQMASVSLSSLALLVAFLLSSHVSFADTSVYHVDNIGIYPHQRVLPIDCTQYGYKGYDCENHILNYLNEYVNVNNSYNNVQRPVIDKYRLLNVSMEVQMMELIDVNFAKGTVTTSILLDYYWQDEFLAWNSSLTDGITFIMVPPTLIFVPDLQNYNSETAVSQQITTYGIYLYSSGQGWMSGKGEFDWMCRFDASRFPYDTQTCTMEYSSFKYSLNWLDVQSIKVTTLDTFTNLAWAVKNVNAYRNVVNLWGGLYPYAFGNVQIVMQRYYQYYETSCVLPSILITVMVVCGLWIPLVQSRVALAATGLLCSTAVVWTATKHVPISKESVWLLQLIVMNICFVGLVFLECGLSSLVASRKLKDGTSPPRWLILLIDISLIPDHIHFSFLEEEPPAVVRRPSRSMDASNFSKVDTSPPPPPPSSISSNIFKANPRPSIHDEHNMEENLPDHIRISQSVERRKSLNSDVNTAVTNATSSSPKSIFLEEDEGQEQEQGHVQMKPIYKSKSFNVEYRMSRHPDEHYTYAKGGAAVSRIYRYVLPIVYAVSLSVYMSEISADRADLPQ